MAETLSPILGASISGQSPVQQNHWASSVADLVGGFAASLGKSKAPGAGNKDQLEASAWDFFGSEMQKAATIAQVEGDLPRAQRIRDGAVAKVTPFIDISSGRGKALIQSVTGEDPDRFMRGTEGTIKDSLVEDESFAGFYLQTDPNLPPNEREALAAADVARVKANQAAIVAARTHWTAEGSAAMIDTIRLGRERGLRIYANNQQPGSNAVEDIRLARSAWEQTKAQMFRPQNITNEEWAPVQEEIDKTDAFFTRTEELLGLPALKNASSTRSAEIIKSIGSAIENNASNLSEWGIAAVALSGDVNAFVQAFPSLTSQAEFIKRLNNLDLVEIGLKEEPDRVMEEIESGMSGATPKEKYDLATGFAKMSNGSDLSTAIKSSPKALNTWTQGTLHGIAALKSLGSDESGSWITSNDYSTVFGPAFFNNLQAVTEVDPAIGAEIKVQALEALNRQGTQLEAMLTGMEQSGPFIWDRTEGTFRLNPNPVGNLSKTGGQGLWGTLTDDRLAPGSVFYGGEGVLQKAVDELYGGDVNALIKDKGARIRRAGLASEQTGISGLVTRVGSEATNYRVLSQQLDSYFRQAGPANAGLYADAYKKNIEVRDKLYATSAQQAGLTYTPPTEEVQGSLPGTTQSDNVINASGSMTQRLMDKYEGGGDYDTLFGHSQNGGPFNGVRITNMTLSQVLDFANPRGQYGQWVKGQVGRVATPMGRFQFVGSTLRQVAKEMGLDLDNTVFTPEVQNAMFTHYATKVIGNKTGAAARSAMRGAWEGFKNASDAELDTMIEEIKTGKANFGPASTSGYRYGGGMGLSSSQNIDDLLPNARGMALETQERLGGSVSLGTEDVDVGSSPEAREVQMDEVNVRGGSEGETSASESVAQSEDAAISAESRRILRNLGLDDSTPVFNSMAEFEENLDDLPEGSVVVVNGRKITV